MKSRQMDAIGASPTPSMHGQMHGQMHGPMLFLVVCFVCFLRAGNNVINNCNGTAAALSRSPTVQSLFSPKDRRCTSLTDFSTGVAAVLARFAIELFLHRQSTAHKLTTEAALSLLVILVVLVSRVLHDVRASGLQSSSTTTKR